MRRLSLANLALLLVVAGLSAWVYLKTPRDESATIALSARLPARATAIRIERLDVPAISLEKKGEIWRLTAPLSAEADAFQVQRLLAPLTARPSQRFPPSDLERFELDRPRTKVTIDDEMFAFGMVNTVTNEQYVLTRDAVYAIEARYGSALPVEAMALVRRQLFSSTETPFRFEMGGFIVEQNGGKWILSPSADTLSQDELARWVENWRLASALRVATIEPGPALIELGVELKSGTSVRLAVRQRTPELVVTREDEGLQYHFPAAIAPRLLQPPGTVRAEPAGEK